MWDFDKFDKVALIEDSGEKVTYKQLRVNCSKSVELIDSRKLVMLVCRNNIECVQFYLGCIRKRIAVMLVEAKMGNENIMSLIQEYAPEFIYAPAEIDITKIESSSCNIRGFCYKQARVDKNYTLYSKELNGNDSINDELAVLLPTSGTTGNKKFVRISYENLISNAKSIVEYLEMDNEEVPMLHLPISYSYGLSVLNTTLMVGGTVVLTEKSIIDKKFWKALVENNVTTFMGVPFHYETLKKLHIDKKDISSIKVMTQAGGKLSENMQRFFGDFARKRGIKFFVMYGQTEATARMTYLPCEIVKEKIGCVGKAIPNGEICIVDDNGNVINQPFEKGEVIYKGKNVSLGYALTKADLSRGNDFDGELKTGDIGYKDEEGLLYITGRKNRIGKYFGKRIQLDDVENMLNKTFGHVFAVNMGEDQIYVLCDEDVEWAVVLDAIQKYTGIASRHIVYIKGKIPRKENGKISYDFEKN